jgi:hypothetical protein
MKLTAIKQLCTFAVHFMGLNHFCPKKPLFVIMVISTNIKPVARTGGGGAPGRQLGASQSSAPELTRRTSPSSAGKQINERQEADLDLIPYR